MFGLAKMAEENNSQQPKQHRILDGTIGFGSLGMSKDRIIGQKSLFHGTSKENAKAIKQEGFRADHGGIGGSSSAVGNKTFVDDSKGLIHMTGMRPYANMYANLTDKSNPTVKKFHDKAKAFNDTLGNRINRTQAEKDEVKHAVNENFKAELKMMGKGFITPHGQNSEILKVKLPYRTFDSNFKRDASGGFNRHMAATTNQNIGPEYIKGSKEFSHLSNAKRLASEFPSYVTNHPGRFGLGLGLAGLGAYGLHNAFKPNKKVGEQ